MDNKKEPVISQQDRALQQLQQAALPVAVYLQNGIKLQGTIVGFDTRVILLRGPTDTTQMIFKHAILTLQPL